VALRVSDVGLLRRRVRVEWAVAEVGSKAIFGEPKDYERRAVPLPAFVVDGPGRAPGRAGARRAGVSVPGRRGAAQRQLPAQHVRRGGGAGRAGRGHPARAAAHRGVAGDLGRATVVVVQRMLGHSSPSVTLDVYSHLFADDLDTVADRLHAAKIATRREGSGRTGTVTAFPVISQGDQYVV
jgi:integrase